MQRWFGSRLDDGGTRTASRSSREVPGSGATIQVSVQAYAQLIWSFQINNRIVDWKGRKRVRPASRGRI